jgi:hypothetical protein
MPVDEDEQRVLLGLAKLKSGQEDLRRALAQADSFSLPGVAEQRARAALGTLRSGLDWLEDTSHFEHAHTVLDSGGRQVRERFGCRLKFDTNTGYRQTCPVALAHTRVGVSPAIVGGEVECSICGEDPEDCLHITGRRYGEEVCRHVVTEAEIFELSVVGRPNQPDARIQSIVVLESELKQSLGSDFRYGMPVSCDRCLTPCPGIEEPSGVHA